MFQISNKIKIEKSADMVWELISSPGHLNQFHPFCEENFVLDKVWHYSEKTETHTVETHIHRLRKKIFSKFGDNNFIKNNNKGYYI